MPINKPEQKRKNEARNRYCTRLDDDRTCFTSSKAEDLADSEIDSDSVADVDFDWSFGSSFNTNALMIAVAKANNAIVKAVSLHPILESKRMESDASAPPNATPVLYRLVAEATLSEGTRSARSVYAVGVENAHDKPMRILHPTTCS